MRLAGIVLASFLVLAIFAGLANNVYADHLKSKTAKNLQEIKPLDYAKTAKVIKITKSRTLHVWSIVEVQVCAGAEKLYSPDLQLSSDRDTIKVTVWGLIMPKSCKANEFFIRADDPDSISVRFLDSNPTPQIGHEKV